tara:strand:+ start:7400 stop:8335 length:936 start_codon:yes stop_codon:yes gene_type:complete
MDVPAPAAPTASKTHLTVHKLLQRAAIPPRVFHLARGLTDASRSTFSSHITITRTGMHLPLDLRRGQDGTALHRDAIHGGLVGFSPSITYDELTRNVTPVRIVSRRETSDSRLKPRRARESLRFMRRTAHLREREHSDERLLKQCVHNNTEPGALAARRHDGDAEGAPRQQQPQSVRVWESFSARERLLPAFQPCMVGRAWCEELGVDNRLVEILPSWFVYAPRVRSTKVCGYVSFLESRYSTSDWKYLMRRVVPDCVFDDDARRVHFQNLTGDVFMRMRLASCIREYDTANLNRALDALRLCKYYRDAFV